MARANRSVLSEGVVAGLIGAAVVAVWFLLFDLARGEPLRTPTFLGAALFYGVDTAIELEPSLFLVLGYTVLHGFAFLAFGVIAASLIAVSEREPTMLVAVVILFAAFEVFFLAVVEAFGHAVHDVFPWWSILVGNLLAAIAMLWYFFRLHRALPGALVGPWGHVLQEGTVAGLIGAATVAVWFLVIDLAEGNLLRTPALLGAAVFGQTSPWMAVSLYTGLHGVAFIAFGIITAFLIAAAERQPMFVFALIILFTAFEVFFFAAVVVTAGWLLDELAAWTIFFANVLAATTMLLYFFRRHRALAHRFAHAWAEED